MDKVQLEIIALANSVSYSNSYTIILGEKGGHRRLPVVIGYFEAQAIAVSIDDIKPSRPLTHDLMRNVCDLFNINLIEVVINELRDGVYYALLVCKKGDAIVEIDSRTSDALALAVRFECPIYVKRDILESVGVEFDEGDDKDDVEFTEESESEVEEIDIDALSVAKQKDFSMHTKGELQEMLQKALDRENYELAAKIRDELNKKK